MCNVYVVANMRNWLIYKLTSKPVGLKTNKLTGLFMELLSWYCLTKPNLTKLFVDPCPPPPQIEPLNNVHWLWIYPVSMQTNQFSWRQTNWLLVSFHILAPTYISLVDVCPIYYGFESGSSAMLHTSWFIFQSFCRNAQGSIYHHPLG